MPFTLDSFFGFFKKSPEEKEYQQLLKKRKELRLPYQDEDSIYFETYYEEIKKIDTKIKKLQGRVVNKTVQEKYNVNLDNDVISEINSFNDYR